MRRYGPGIAMVGLLVVGAALVWGPLTPHEVPTRPESRMVKVVVAGTRGSLEAIPGPGEGEWAFRLLFARDGFDSRYFSAAEVEQVFGPAVLRRLTTTPHNPILAFFNITSWWNLAWITVGLLGQVAFSTRMIVQWLVSERRRESTVPVVFWWLSLFGGAALFTYFCWRQDFVGILGQAPGVVVYARNLWLIHRISARGVGAAAEAGAVQAA